MYLAAGKHYIELHSWETATDLKRALSTCQAGCLILGEAAESPNAFYSLTIYLGWQGLPQFGIGLCAEEHGLKPYWLWQPTVSEVWLGFNREVVAIGLEDQQIHFRVLLDSWFHSFVRLDQYRNILVFHEIGLVALQDDGQELWRYTRDVIEEIDLQGDYLQLTFLDAPPVSLFLPTGVAQKSSKKITPHVSHFPRREEISPRPLGVVGV